MSRHSRVAVLALSSWMVLAALAPAAEAQGRVVRRHPTHPARPVAVRGQVFIGGYFYDPFFGPYPWWPRTLYPHWYVPQYNNRAELRIQVVPDEADRAAVYVDGFYAGIVNDFDGVFQGLPLTPGGHTIVLYLEGYRTVRHNIYLSPGSTFRIREAFERLPAGITSEPPELAPPLPPPPPGSYKPPLTPPRDTAFQSGAAMARPLESGTVDLFVQPPNAEVLIDGQPWVTSEEGHFVVQLPVGRHRVEIRRPGYRPFTTEIDIRTNETRPLNVSLRVTS